VYDRVVRLLALLLFVAPPAVAQADDDVAALVARLDERDAAVRAEAAIGLRALGDVARPALEQRVRERRSVGEARRARIAALVAQLDHERPAIREEARLLLTAEGRAALEPLEGALGDAPPPQLRPLLAFLRRCPDEARVEAALLLATLGDAGSVPALREALTAGDEQLGLAAGFALRALTGDGPVADPAAWVAPHDEVRDRWEAFFARGLPDPWPTPLPSSVALVDSESAPAGTERSRFELKTVVCSSVRAFAQGAERAPPNGSAFTWAFGRPLPGRFHAPFDLRGDVIEVGPPLAVVFDFVAMDVLGGDAAAHPRFEARDVAVRVLPAGRLRRFVSVVVRTAAVGEAGELAGTFAGQGVATIDAATGRATSLEVDGFWRQEVRPRLWAPSAEASPSVIEVDAVRVRRHDRAP
jgi:hypothetical protein